MGIKAEDLRRGNLLNFDGRIVKVSVIGSDYLGVKDGHKISSLDYSWLKPIPLTEDWLADKFGFEKTDDFGDQVYYEPKDRGNRSYYICFDHDDISFGLVVFGNCTSLIYDDSALQYVHQLQNLYYALTNTELTIK